MIKRTDFDWYPCDEGWKAFVEAIEAGKSYEQIIAEWRVDDVRIEWLEWAHSFAENAEMITALDNAGIGYFEAFYDDYDDDYDDYVDYDDYDDYDDDDDTENGRQYEA